MKNALLASALGLSVYALSAGANAGQRSTGWYVGAEGGANWIDNADVAFNTGFGNFEAEFESGWAVFAEVGVSHHPRVHGRSNALTLRTVAMLSRDLLRLATRADRR